MSEGEETVADAPEELPYERFDCTGDDPEIRAQAIDAARSAIERGLCVVMPTDTVYGIGADAFSADAVQGLLDAKIRGRDMPPPVLIAEPSLIRALATDVSDQAKDLVARHWPGPLTIICKRQPSLRMDLGDVEDTVALRVPDHELARDVLRSTGPMAVSSANISGMPATLNVQDAIDQLHDRVAVYLDGGPSQTNGGAPSTIVDFSQSPDGEVLRRGALSVAVLRETCPDIVDLTDPDDDEPASTDEPDDPDDALETDETLEPDEPETAADIRSQIETAADDSPVEDEPIRDATVVEEPDAEPYREPTTDELRITHADIDPDQPDLFSDGDPKPRR